LDSKFSILGNNINLVRDELRKTINVEIKAIIEVITKIDTQ
jgi:hypothetical protein